MFQMQPKIVDGSPPWNPSPDSDVRVLQTDENGCPNIAVVRQGLHYWVMRRKNHDAHTVGVYQFEMVDRHHAAEMSADTPTGESSQLFSYVYMQ